MSVMLLAELLLNSDRREKRAEESSRMDSGRSLKTVSLFAGAGGLDYGLEAAGFDVVAAVEMDRDSVATLRTNRSWAVLNEPIEDVESARLLDVAGVQRGELDLLVGGPPCQPFSKSGYWSNGDTKRLDDPRARTLVEYMRCVEDLLPKVFLLENVYGIGYEGKSEGLDFIAGVAAQINGRTGARYRLSRKLLNTAEYGVPQIRERFFVVGHRDGGVFEFPKPSHRLPSDDENGLLSHAALAPALTAWDAIGHLSAPDDEDLRIRGKWADLLPSIPEGENYLWHTPKKPGMPLFGWRSRYWSFLLKLSKAKPSWTIQAQPGPNIGPFHWENRRLSVREMAAIQTFPPGIRFVGSRQSVQRQLGNAVPSLMAEVLGRAIRQQFFGDGQPGALTLAVEARRPIPAPETVVAVPKKFRSLAADHPDYKPRPRRRSGTVDIRGTLLDVLATGASD